MAITAKFGTPKMSLPGAKMGGFVPRVQVKGLDKISGVIEKLKNSGVDASAIMHLISLKMLTFQQVFLVLFLAVLPCNLKSRLYRP